MSRPRLFFGSKTSGVLMRVGAGYDDLGVEYVPMLVSNPEASNEVEGEGIFTAIYLALNHRAPPLNPSDPYEEVEVTITPIVDMVEYESTTFTIRMQPQNEGLPPERVTRPYEIGLSRAWSDGGVEQGRVALRGTFFQLRVDLPSTEIQLLKARVEAEAVEEDLTPVGT